MSLLDDEDKIINKNITEQIQGKIKVDEGIDFNISDFAKWISENILGSDSSMCTLIKHLEYIRISKENPSIKRRKFTESTSNDENIIRFYKGDLLGAYFHNGPRIELYYKNIDNHRENLNCGFCSLLKVVFIHELMHAQMDSKSEDETKWYETIYGYWREESFANALSLALIDSIGCDKLKETAIKLISSQHDAYKYGLTVYADSLHNKPIDITWWKNIKGTAPCFDKNKILWLKGLNAI